MYRITQNMFLIRMMSLEHDTHVAPAGVASYLTSSCYIPFAPLVLDSLLSCCYIPFVSPRLVLIRITATEVRKVYRLINAIKTREPTGEGLSILQAV